MESPKWKFNKEDFKQMGIKLLMLIVAFAIPEIIKELNNADFGDYQYVASGAIFMLSYAGQRLKAGK